MLFLNQLDTAKLIPLFIDYLNSVTWLIAIDTILLFFTFFQYNSYIRIFLLNEHDPCPIMSSLVKILFSWNNLINLFFFFICTRKSELQNSAMLGIIILAIISVVIILLIACTYISEKCQRRTGGQQGNNKSRL